MSYNWQVRAQIKTLFLFDARATQFHERSEYNFSVVSRFVSRPFSDKKFESRNRRQILRKTDAKMIITQPNNNEILKKEMAEKGVIFGRKISKTHPEFKKHISGSRNNVALINFDSTIASLKCASDFLKEKIKSGGKVLFVGCLPAAKESVEETAIKFDCPYVVNRWIGGLLTNFKIIRKRIDYFLDLKKKRDSGKLEKYTKKEKIKLNKEIERMSSMFKGAEKMEKIPDVIFAVNIKEHSTAVKEARRLNMPIVAIVNTNVNPRLVDYPIFANDNAKASIAYILGKISEEITK